MSELQQELNTALKPLSDRLTNIEQQLSEQRQEQNAALQPMLERLSSIEQQLNGMMQEQATYSNRVDSFMKELLVRLKDEEKNSDLGQTIRQFIEALNLNTQTQEDVAQRMTEFVSMVNDSLYEMGSSQN